MSEENEVQMLLGVEENGTENKVNERINAVKEVIDAFVTQMEEMEVDVVLGVFDPVARQQGVFVTASSSEITRLGLSSYINRAVKDN